MPFIAGVVQQQNAAVPRPRRRCDSVHPLHLRPCGVVQLTRLPLMQEITGAKPVRDTNLTVLKALSAMYSLGKRISLVQLRVRAPFMVAMRKHRSRASAQAGFISPLCPGQHWRLRPAFALRATARRAIFIPPPCSSLRISFVKKSCRGSTGWRLHLLCGTAQAVRVAQCRGTTSRASHGGRAQAPCRAHQFHGVEATADRHPAFTRTW